MWKFIKKWWFLQRLEFQINYHTGKSELENILSGRTVFSSKGFFIDGTSKYPGIAKRPLGKFFSWLLFWRWVERKEHYKRRVHKYMKFFNQWEEKKYIEMIKIQKNQHITHMPNLTFKGEDAHGLFGLIELLLERYPLVSSSTGKISAFIITTVVGSTGLIYLIIKLINKFI